MVGRPGDPGVSVVSCAPFSRGVFFFFWLLLFSWPLRFTPTGGVKGGEGVFERGGGDGVDIMIIV